MDFDASERRDWHYVPRPRPGLPLRVMDENQRRAANALLRVGLSGAGRRLLNSPAPAQLDSHSVAQRGQLLGRQLRHVHHQVRLLTVSSSMGRREVPAPGPWKRRYGMVDVG